MEEQLPYRAEYAKSNRAKCKGCQAYIGEGSLRLAAMVQSAFADTKQAAWFHYKCFFAKQRPKTVGDIAYFENLRYPDQKKIKESIASSMAIVAPPEKGKGKKRGAKSVEPSSALKDFGIEYSKSGRAECRGCQQKILKDEIRIKKVVYDTEVGMKYGGQPLWHHLDCFEQIHADLGFFSSGEYLPGFKQLSKEDQTKVKSTIKAKTDAPQIKKVKKEETPEDDKKIKKQFTELYSFKDKLNSLSKNELIEILDKNDQSVPEGKSAIIDRIADILTFGVPKPCKKCVDGDFVLGKNSYVCTGTIDEWTKCMTSNPAPPRVKVVLPNDLKSTYTFLGKYKPRVCDRIFEYVPPSAPSVNIKKDPEEKREGPKVIREKPKLYNMEFVIIGETSMDKDEIKKLITKLGGSVKTKLHSGVAAIISNPDEIEKMNKRMSEVEDLGIHVVTDDFLNLINKDSDVFKMLDTHSICDWGVDPLKRIPQEEIKKEKRGLYTKSSKSSKVTLKLKGGGAVDPDSGLDDVAHVYEENSTKYNAILTLTDIQIGKNSYYKLQLLQSDKGNQYWLFRGWGRIGTTIGDTKIENHSTLNSAKKQFESIYLDKTGNEFGDDFMKLPGFYSPIDIDYSDKSKKISDHTDVKSKLKVPIQELIKLLFDVDLMKKVMLEFELDTEKMPLGKLSKDQLGKAYKTLNELTALIAKGANQHDFIGATNKFYTLVPHNFGVNQPPLLNTNEIINSKIEMIDSLMEIEIAYNMLNDSNIDENISPIDAHYEQLKTEMSVVDKKTEEFKLLQQYVKNTHAETHKMFDLEVQDIFKIKRKGEDKRYKPFKKLHNRKLLWHGSRLTNFVGILSHGLKIAPPEAPVTGYMFGKGIYFADMVSKSANYCFTSKANNTGLLMLCEVALGDMVEYVNAEYVTKLPKNKHSVKGIGKTQPNPDGTVKREDGVEIPCGLPIKDDKLKSSLLYNEYIVYDVAQVNAQYLFKLKFNYKY